KPIQNNDVYAVIHAPILQKTFFTCRFLFTHPMKHLARGMRAEGFAFLTGRSPRKTALVQGGPLVLLRPQAHDASGGFTIRRTLHVPQHAPAIRGNARSRPGCATVRPPPRRSIRRRARLRRY